MKTFAQKTKKSTHAVRRTHAAVLPFSNPVAQVQRAQVRQVLRAPQVQAKLTIGQPNDKYEQEADRIADEVMRMPEEAVPRQPEDKERKQEEIIQAKAVDENVVPVKTSEGPAAEVTRIFESGINTLGSGQPLSKETRNFFEPRFGMDFSGIRVHTVANANQLARSINARAFTRRNDIVFGTGEYIPESSNGRKLLGHELAHVLQQSRRQKMVDSKPSGIVQRRKRKKRKGGVALAARPKGIDFSSADPIHVPSCGNFSARTNVPNVTWSLRRVTTIIAPGTKINARGKITIDVKQMTGRIDVRATNKAGYFFQRPLRIRSHPTGITRTNIINTAGPASYGGTFDHVFSSNDGNVRSLQDVGVGERFAQLSAGTRHIIRPPILPFGRTFTLRTGRLTPNARRNWFLTDAGHLGGGGDNVTIGRRGINVAQFVRSASNPKPRFRLPADMTIIQGLYWYCPQERRAHRWKRFVNVAHSRTLRASGGRVHFVTTVNGIELPQAYHQPIAVYNATPSPISTPHSARAPAAQRMVRIMVDTLPTIIPAGQPLRFSLVGNSHGCRIAADPGNGHAGILRIGRRAGRVRVKVSDHTRKNFDLVSVTIT